jgi:hypothetical protein
MQGVFCTEIVPVRVGPVCVNSIVKVPVAAGSLVLSYVPFHVPATAPDAGTGVVETAPPVVLGITEGADGAEVVDPPPPPPHAAASVATATSTTVDRMIARLFKTPPSPTAAG